MPNRGLACAAFLVISCAMLAAQDRPIITVLDLKTEGVSSGEMRSVVALLSSGLFKSGKYTVIDVTERDRLLKEVELNGTACAEIWSAIPCVRN